MTETSRLAIYNLNPWLIAFYNGRTPQAANSSGANWQTDSALALGVASYAIADGAEALVYDTHISLAHARDIRAHLEARGVTRIRVVLSHWHLDHVAGNEVFADCEIIAHERTLDALQRRKTAIETGTCWGRPAIRPLIPPNRTYDECLTLSVGAIEVEVQHVDIHSRDGSVLYLPHHRLLLAGDTVEDTVTYVVEPDRLETHLTGLARMARWNIARVLPNHGDAARIAGGGYAPSLITATERYVERLLRCQKDHALARQDLRAFVAGELNAGWIAHFEPYEQVHERNVALVLVSDHDRAALANIGS